MPMSCEFNYSSSIGSGSFSLSSTIHALPLQKFLEEIWKEQGGNHHPSYFRKHVQMFYYNITKSSRLWNPDSLEILGFFLQSFVQVPNKSSHRFP